MYSVVTFPKSKTCEVVPSSWLREENDTIKCLWPQYGSTRLAKAIRSLELPSDAWMACDCRILDSTDSFKEADQKAEKAQYCSDLGTASLSDAENFDGKRKRIKNTKRFMDTASSAGGSESDDLQAYDQKSLKRRKLKKPASKTVSKLGNCSSSDESDIHGHKVTDRSKNKASKAKQLVKTLPKAKYPAFPISRVMKESSSTNLLPKQSIAAKSVVVFRSDVNQVCHLSAISVSEGNRLASRSHPHETPPRQSAPATSVLEGNQLASRSHPHEAPPGQSAPASISVLEGNQLASRSHPHETPPGRSAPVAPAITVSEGNPLASRSHPHETPPGRSAPVAPAISVLEGNQLASRSHLHETPPGESAPAISVSEGNQLASRSHPHETPPGRSAPVAPAISVSEGNPLASRSHPHETLPGQSAPVAPAISVSEGNPLASRSHPHETPPGQLAAAYTMPGQVTFNSYVTPVRHRLAMDSTPSSRYTASRNIGQTQYPEEFPQQLSAVTILDRKVLLTLEELKAHASLNTNLLHQIIGMMQENPSNDPELFQLPAGIMLPLKSLPELENLEQHIMDPDIKAKLIRYLALVGGPDVQTCVRAIMKRLLTYETAELFSFKGRRGKLCFQSLKLYAVVCDAVRRNSATLRASDSDVDAPLKDWLKHAKNRMQQQASRLSNLRQ